MQSVLILCTLDIMIVAEITWKGLYVGSNLIRQKKHTLFRDCKLPWSSSMVYVRRGLHRKLSVFIIWLHTNGDEGV